MLTLIVSKDNSGNYTSISEAINAVSYREKARIIVKEGIYREKLFSDKSDIELIGEGNVFITFSDSGREILDNGLKRGTFRSYTAFFSGERLLLENITIHNGAGSGKDVGQAISLYLDVDNAYLKNVKLLGHQDTLFLSPLPEEEREKRGFYGPRCFSPRVRKHSVFEECTIEGSVDFIFGGGDAEFRNCNIVSNDDGFVTAPSGKSSWDGLLFEGCKFTSPLNKKENVYLMRPWRDEGKAIFNSCTFGPHINRRGFISWPGREDKAELATFEMNNCVFI